LSHFNLETMGEEQSWLRDAQFAARVRRSATWSATPTIRAAAAGIRIFKESTHWSMERASTFVSALPAFDPAASRRQPSLRLSASRYFWRAGRRRGESAPELKEKA
jgi:hypothetical protein